MSDTKHDIEHYSHTSEPMTRQLTTVTLSAEQFEQLYLQPMNNRNRGWLSDRVGNPTPLYANRNLHGLTSTQLLLQGRFFFLVRAYAFSHGFVRLSRNNGRFWNSGTGGQLKHDNLWLHLNSLSLFFQVFYACCGIGLYLACIMEWIIGNTFPSVVFGTFGKCAYTDNYEFAFR